MGHKLRILFSFTGVLGGLLTKRFTARLVLMVFGLLAATGVVGSSAATTLPVLAMCVMATGKSCLTMEPC